MKPGIPADALPPHNRVAEQSVLGSILLHNESLELVNGRLKAEHFYLRSHSLIYESILRTAAARSGTVTGIDVVTLAEHLDARGELTDVGGVPYLLEILAAVPHAAHIVFYTDTVISDSQRRSLMAVGQRAIAAATDRSREIDDCFGDISQRLQTAMEAGLKEVDTSIATLIEDTIAAADEPKATRLDTGLPSLNAVSRGPAFGVLSLIAGRPSHGKTALLTQIAMNAAWQGSRVLIYSLEMTHREIIERLLATAVGCASEELWHPSRRDRVRHEADILKTLPIDIDATMPDLPEMLTKTSLLVRRKGVKVVIVDYVQLVSSGKKFEIREQEVASVSRALKKAANNLDVAMLVASQLNRDVEKRTIKRPMLSDLRESGSLEQDADQVMLLWRPNKDAVGPEAEPDNFAEVIVAKNRNGQTGAIELDWHGPTTRFRDRMAVDPAIANWDSP